MGLIVVSFFRRKTDNTWIIVGINMRNLEVIILELLVGFIIC